MKLQESLLEEMDLPLPEREVAHRRNINLGTNLLLPLFKKTQAVKAAGHLYSLRFALPEDIVELFLDIATHLRLLFEVCFLVIRLDYAFANDNVLGFEILHSSIGFLIRIMSQDASFRLLLLRVRLPQLRSVLL